MQILVVLVVIVIAIAVYLAIDSLDVFLLIVLAACGGPPAVPTKAPAQKPTPTPEVGPPVARTVDVVEEKFGLRVPDPYRWMEGDDNPERDAWMRAHAAHAAKKLAALPGRAALHGRIRQLGLGSSKIEPPQLAGGSAFYLETSPGEQLGKLVVRDASGSTRTLVDPNASVGSGRQAISNFTPSPDGTLVAYHAASSGGEVGSVRILEVATGKPRPDVIDRVWGEFPISWLPDSKGFFYSQMAEPRPNVDPMLDGRVRLHELGRPTDRDPVLWTRGVGSVALEAQEFPEFWVPRGTSWIVASAVGARKAQRIAIAPLAELDRTGSRTLKLRVVAGYEDNVEDVDVRGDRLYMLSSKDAPNRRILSVPVRRPELAAARVEVAESRDAVLERFAFARDALYLRELVAGVDRVRRMPWRARESVVVPLPFAGTVARIATDPTRDGATIQLESWTHPATHLAYANKTGTFEPTGVAQGTSADVSAVVATITSSSVVATASDGEQVPLSIVHRRDVVRGGSHPTLLAGYAAYGVSLKSYFNPELLAWLERGGVIAFCHGRGGGEKGDRWYRAGVRENKLVGVRDFIACGEQLLATKWATPGRLAAVGGSAGALLVGRAMLEKPSLFAAVILRVGFVNPLRMLVARNGANQIAELGSPETEQGFRQIHAIDPYAQIDPAQSYPPVLFTIGLTDGRVAPWMTAKMAARLKATRSRRPVWIRADADAGHGVGSANDQIYAELADVLSFVSAHVAK